MSSEEYPESGKVRKLDHEVKLRAKGDPDPVVKAALAIDKMEISATKGAVEMGEQHGFVKSGFGLLESIFGGSQTTQGFPSGTKNDFGTTRDLHRVMEVDNRKIRDSANLEELKESVSDLNNSIGRELSESKEDTRRAWRRSNVFLFITSIALLQSFGFFKWIWKLILEILS